MGSTWLASLETLSMNGRCLLLIQGVKCCGNAVRCCYISTSVNEVHKALQNTSVMQWDKSWFPSHWSRTPLQISKAWRIWCNMTQKAVSQIHLRRNYEKTLLLKNLFVCISFIPHKLKLNRTNKHFIFWAKMFCYLNKYRYKSSNTHQSQHLPSLEKCTGYRDIRGLTKQGL